MKIKILLVDDHPMLRNGISTAIGQQPNLSLVGEAGNGKQALKLAEQLMPDLVVMDFHMADLNGIEVARQMIAAHSSIKIIMFSSDGSRSLVDEALQAGACGYVLKRGEVDELMQAIGVVMEGRIYLSPELTEVIIDDYRRNLNKSLEERKPILTELENKLLRLVSAGRRNKEIAADLAISTKSVEAYRSRVMKKLGCSSMAELVRYAIREGIAEP